MQVSEYRAEITEKHYESATAKSPIIKRFRGKRELL